METQEYQLYYMEEKPQEAGNLYFHVGQSFDTTSYGDKEHNLPDKTAPIWLRIILSRQ